MANPNGAAGGGRGAALNGPNYQVVKFHQDAACPSVPVMTAGLELTNDLFQGEKENGSQVFYGPARTPNWIPSNSTRARRSS